MAKLTEYPAAAKFDSGDILIKDGSGGTMKIAAEDAAIAFAGMISAENHRNVYRGKSLGSSVTAAQKTAIQNGTFDDLFIGDYWTIGGVNYRIADMDYWYKCGGDPFYKHHLVIVPDTVLYGAPMNTTSSTTGGYVGSAMYEEKLAQAKTTILSAFGDMLLTHDDFFINAVTNGLPSGGAWFKSNVDLMNEIMVYGSHIYTPGGTGVAISIRYTISRQQLALFALNPEMVVTRNMYWLRDVVNASMFATVHTSGNASCNSALTSCGVRPAFSIG